MERKDRRMHPEDVGAGSSGGKRRHVLTIQQKVELLRKMDRGVSVSRLHRKYGVGQSTIYDIKAEKNQIFQFVAESDSMAGISKRKILRGPNNIDLDKVVYEWFRQRRSEGIPISGPMLMEKAKSYHEELKIEGDCDYSAGWLQKLKNRHGIRSLKISGEICRSTSISRSFLEAGDASTYVEPSPSDEGSVSQSPHKVGRKVRITRTAESIDFGTKLSEELPSCEPVSPNNNDLRADFDDYIFHASSVQKELHIPKSDIKGKEALDHSNNRMPRSKPKRDFENIRKRWDVDNMTKAITAVRDNKMGFLKAAKQFKVPRTTLYRLSSNKDVEPQVAAVTKLGRKPAPRRPELRKERSPKPGTSSENPPVTIVCAPDLSSARSPQSAETSEDPLAISLSPSVQTEFVQPTRFENASNSISLVYSPEQAATGDEVTIKYFGGDPEISLDETFEPVDQNQNDKNIEKVLLQLRAEKLLLEMDKLKQERQKTAAEKRNIQLRNKILSLRMQLVKPLDVSTSLQHSTGSSVVSTAQTSSVQYCTIPLQKDSLNTSASQNEGQLPVQNLSPPYECHLRQIPDSHPIAALPTTAAAETALQCCATEIQSVSIEKPQPDEQKVTSGKYDPCISFCDQETDSKSTIYERSCSKQCTDSSEMPSSEQKGESSTEEECLISDSDIHRPVRVTLNNKCAAMTELYTSSKDTGSHSNGSNNFPADVDRSTIGQKDKMIALDIPCLNQQKGPESHNFETSSQVHQYSTLTDVTKSAIEINTDLERDLGSWNMHSVGSMDKSVNIKLGVSQAYLGKVCSTDVGSRLVGSNEESQDKSSKIVQNEFGDSSSMPTSVCGLDKKISLAKRRKVDNI